MENWPSLADLDGLYAQAAGWLDANLLAGAAVPQVLAIAGSFLVARVLAIPNEDLIGERVENWSHSNNLLRLHAPFSIAYGSDLQRAVAVAEQAARDCARVLASPEPHCLVLAFGDSAVDLELRLWINDPRNGVHNVKSQVLMRVCELYHQHGIEVPYPQRDLHLKTAVPVTIVRTSDHSVGETETRRRQTGKARSLGWTKSRSG